jgi:hypothetical protein
MSLMVGQITQEQYEQLVAEGREVMAQITRGQFQIGDMALLIAPMQSHGGHQALAAGEEGMGVAGLVARFAADLDLAPSTMQDYRWVSSRWPKEWRVAGVCHTVHKILAAEPDEQTRWSILASPPEGRGRWTLDEANRHMGWAVQSPASIAEKVRKVADLVSDDEVATAALTGLLGRPEVTGRVPERAKVSAIHELARDEKVAVTAATGLLGRPEVTARVSAADKSRVIRELARDEDVAEQAANDLLRRPAVAARVVDNEETRHSLNRAQVDRAGRMESRVRQEHAEIGQAGDRVAHTMQFMDLIGMCAVFTADAGRVVPSLRGQSFTEDERATIARNIARVRGAADWIESAVDTGNVSLDDGFAQLLSGQ